MITYEIRKGNAIASKYTDIGLERYKARCGI